MKRILLLSIAFLLLQHESVMAQNKTTLPPKLSPQTQQYLHAIHQSNYTEAPLPGYVYKETAGGQHYISSLVKVLPAFNEQDLLALGASIGTKAGNIWTVQVPVAQVEAFTRLPGMEYIQLDEPVYPSMDSVRKATRVDSVHAGINLPAPFTGKDVIMGIIDVGFDYSHPLFFDTSGTQFRIRKVWEQKTAGTPPAGFIYGRELTDSAAMWLGGTDNAGQSHGTHVAGIAAGSGYGSFTDNKRFRGMAYGTDVVLVGITPAQSQWFNTGMADMIDGMHYIYDYATSVSKPAVINLSWGSSTGPHDGTSLFSQACDNLTGSGRIFVCSGGNNGDQNIHLQKTFTPTDTVLNTFVTFDAGLASKTTWVDVWGDTAKAFCIQVTLYNSGAAGNTTGFICLDNTIHNAYLIGSNGDTCFIKITTSSAEFNAKPRVFLDFYSKVPDDINLSIKGSDGKVNLWASYVLNSTGYYGPFTNGGQSWATAGNTITSLGDIATTKSALTVAAFAAKNTYINISGSHLSYTGYVSRGNIVPFSSRGPTVDGRIKPDIAAPGFCVGSAINSYDAAYLTGGAGYGSVISQYVKPQNGRTYGYAQLSGTSMSSPVTAGIVALMLEANPALTPQQVKDVLYQTAIKDNFTGVLPAIGNNIWGHGKVNAYASLKTMTDLLGVVLVQKGTLSVKVYPNPNHGGFYIDCTNDRTEMATVEVLNILGKVLVREELRLSAGNNIHPVDARYLSNGVYFLRITTASKGQQTRKVVID